MDIIRVLVKFFVRRNLTASQPTRDVDRIFVTLIADVKAAYHEGESSEAILKRLRAKLSGVSASLGAMRTALEGDLYLDNSAVARFVLCALEEETMTRETETDFH